MLLLSFIAQLSPILELERRLNSFFSVIVSLPEMEVALS